jgi:two-component system sensor histidine kinase AlgZ
MSAPVDRRSRVPFSRRLLIALLVNAVVAIVILVLRAWLSLDRSVGWVAIGFIISIVYANSVWTLSNLALPSLAPRFAKLTSPSSWILLSSTILVITVVGCVAAVLTLIAIDIFPRGNLWKLLSTSMFLAAPVSFIIGFSRYIYEGMRHRLQTTTLKLAAKELDEERAHKLAAEARLSSLESRVHPHFLFNTLNSISSLIQEDPVLAERMVERLSALLRFSLDSNQYRTVPLRKEINIVVDYLEIEKARFGDRLRYSVDVPRDLESVEVPPLSLQTLVENSVKYVVSQRRDGGEVLVKARLEGGRVQIDVSDDGPGFTPEAITAGHGLDNVQGRLAALFDDRASLSISTLEGHTRVTIAVPNESAPAIVRV